MDFQSQPRVNALGRPDAIAAQIAARPVGDKLRNARIKRGFALRACCHRAVTEQNVRFRAPEGQRGGERAFQRHRVRI